MLNEIIRSWRLVEDFVATIRLRGWIHHFLLTHPRVTLAEVRVALPSDDEVLMGARLGQSVEGPSWVSSKIRELRLYEQLDRDGLEKEILYNLQHETYHPYGRINLFDAYVCLLQRGGKQHLLIQMTPRQYEQLAQVLREVLVYVRSAKAA